MRWATAMEAWRYLIPMLVSRLQRRAELRRQLRKSILW